MVDVIIIVICIIAAVNIGFDGLQLLPEDILEGVSNIEAGSESYVSPSISLADTYRIELF